MFFGGWIVRLSDGHTRRTNFANALYPLLLISAELVGWIVGGVSAGRIGTRVSPDPLASKGCAALLHDRGFYPNFGRFADSLSGDGLPRVTIAAAATD